jgi:hypothetical protein
MNMLIQDLRHGFRRLVRSPAFAGLIVLSLGLGIGANVALFRLLDAAIPRSLPVASAERLIGAAMGEGGGFFAASGRRSAPEWRASSAGGQTGCVRIAVIGIHTTVSFRMARRSGEIGVRVAVGDAGREPCA